MNVADNDLPDLNTNTFPAKLWRLVNNPAYESIRWDAHGEFVIIDQQRFERQILSPGTFPSNKNDAFKTTNFSSFIRQLNLYGFKKVQSADKITSQFYNPNFKRNHPELVPSLRRLTVDNKAKLQAGVDVSCRLLKRCKRQEEDDDDDRERNLKRSTTHPPDGEGPSPVFSPTIEMPVPIGVFYNEVASTSGVMNAQQHLMIHVNPGNPNLTPFIPRNAQYWHGCSHAVCHRYHTDIVLQQMGLLPLQSSYEAEYPVNMPKIKQELLHKENREVKKFKINLDTIFQIAEELMPVLPNTRLVKVETANKPDLGLGPSDNNGEALLHKSSSSATAANPVCVAAAVSGSPATPSCKQLQNSVLSAPEQTPPGDIFEATTDRAEDDENISVLVLDTDGDSSLD